MWRDQFSLDMQRRCFMRVTSFIGELPRDHVVESGAQAVDIAAEIHGIAQQTFRRDVLWGTLDLIAELMQCLGGLGQTEVRKLHATIATQNDIVRLNVAVDQLTISPCVTQRQCHPSRGFQGPLQGGLFILVDDLFH